MYNYFNKVIINVLIFFFSEKTVYIINPKRESLHSVEKYYFPKYFNPESIRFTSKWKKQ